MDYTVECERYFSTDEMDDDDVRMLFEKRFPHEDLITQYYHGDIDLVKLIKEIGKEEVQKIIDSK